MANLNIRSELKWVVVPLLALFVYIFGFQFSLGMDLPNHLARAHIMGQCLGSGTADLCRNYLVSFIPLPYFFSDFTLTILLQLFSPNIAEKVALMLMLSIFVIGWFRLFVAVNGTPNFAYVAGLVLVLNNYLYKGFFAYLLSFGMVLCWLAAWWIRRDDKSLKNQSILILGLIIIFGFHLAGFIIALTCYFTYDLYSLLRSGRLKLPSSCRFVAGSWPIVTLFVLLYFWQQYATGGTLAEPPSSQDFGATLAASWWYAKVIRLSYTFINHAKYFDLSIIAGLALTLLCTQAPKSILQLLKGYWALLFFVLIALYFVVPDVSHGASDVDLRFLLLACFVVFLVLGQRPRPNKLAMPVVLFLLTCHFGINLWYKHLAQSELLVMDRALSRAEPGESLVGISSKTSFPASSASRVNIYAHFSDYYILKGGALVDGIFNCGTNKNNTYFCYRDSEIRAPDFRAQFEGLPALSQEDLARLQKHFTYFFIVEERPELVRALLDDSSRTLVFHEGDVYLVKNPGVRGDKGTTLLP